MVRTETMAMSEKHTASLHASVTWCGLEDGVAEELYDGDGHGPKTMSGNVTGLLTKRARTRWAERWR